MTGLLRPSLPATIYLSKTMTHVLSSQGVCQRCRCLCFVKLQHHLGARVFVEDRRRDAPAILSSRVYGAGPRQACGIVPQPMQTPQP